MNLTLTLLQWDQPWSLLFARSTCFYEARLVQWYIYGAHEDRVDSGAVSRHGESCHHGGLCAAIQWSTQGQPQFMLILLRTIFLFSSKCRGAKFVSSTIVVLRESCVVWMFRRVNESWKRVCMKVGLEVLHRSSINVLNKLTSFKFSFWFLRIYLTDPPAT